MRESCPGEVVEQNLVELPPLSTHYRRPNLAQAHTVAPSGTKQCEPPGQTVGIRLAGFYYKGRTVEVAWRERAAYFEFFAYDHGMFCACATIAMISSNIALRIVFFM